jgi:O-antigen/teichoic acid export membrane protein
MVWFAAPQVLRQATFLLIVWLMVAGPGDVTRLPAAEIAGIALAGAAYALLARRRGLSLRLNLRGALDRDLLRESLPIGGTNFIWALRMYLPIVALLFVAGPETTALFGVSHRIVMVFQSLLGVYFTNLFPTISQVARDTGRLTRLLQRSLGLTILLTTAGATLVLFIPSLILGTVYGPAFVRGDSVWTLALLTWLIPILAWRRHGTSALIAMNRQADELWCSVGGIAVLVAFILPASSYAGAIGAVSVMLMSELAASALTWWRTQVAIKAQPAMVSQPLA